MKRKLINEEPDLLIEARNEAFISLMHLTEGAKDTPDVYFNSVSIANRAQKGAYGIILPAEVPELLYPLIFKKAVESVKIKFEYNSKRGTHMTGYRANLGMLEDLV